jgi:hypothetical protein
VKNPGTHNDEKLITSKMSTLNDYAAMFILKKVNLTAIQPGSTTGYQVYEFGNANNCSGICRLPGSSFNNPDNPNIETRLQISDGILVVGNNPSIPDNKSFYFKDGYLIAFKHPAIKLPVDLYLVPYGQTISNDKKLNITDYYYTPISRTVNFAGQQNHPFISGSNYTTTFNNYYGDQTRPFSFTTPRFANFFGNNNFKYISYGNVQFVNHPIWTRYQTGDARLANSLMKLTFFSGSRIFYKLYLTSSNKVPTKLIVELQDGCACAPWIWNNGSNFTSLPLSPIDMKKFDYSTSSTNTHPWTVAGNGNNLFSADLTALNINRQESMFNFEINNDANSDIYGIRFMFLDADNNIVNYGSDNLGQYPWDFVGWDQLLRLFTDQSNYVVYSGEGGNGQGGTNENHQVRSRGSAGTNDDPNRRSDIFAYDFRMKHIYQFEKSDADQIGYCLGIRGSECSGSANGCWEGWTRGPATKGYYIRTNLCDSGNNTMKWNIEPTEAGSRYVQIVSVSDTNLSFNVQGDNAYTAANEIILWDKANVRANRFRFSSNLSRAQYVDS